MDFLGRALNGLRAIKDTRFKGNVLAMAKEVNVSQPTLHRWLTGERKPQLAVLAPVLDALGAKITFPGEEEPHLAREVCFADPIIKGVVPYAEFESRLKPVAEDYLAVPLVKEVGAGHGLLEESKTTDWVLVNANSLPRPTTPALCAVRVAKNQRSMVPLLHPGDLVLVDKGRYRPDDDGKIWMVKDPEGGEMIKRVATTHRDGDLELIFYSDNVAEYRPETWRLKRDFDGDIKNAIAGRVLWAWTDVTRK